MGEQEAFDLPAGLRRFFDECAAFRYAVEAEAASLTALFEIPQQLARGMNEKKRYEVCHLAGFVDGVCRERKVGGGLCGFGNDLSL